MTHICIYKTNDTHMNCYDTQMDLERYQDHIVTSSLWKLPRDVLEKSKNVSLSYVRAPALIQRCAMTHSYVYHDSFICVTCPFKGMPWLIHMCALLHSLHRFYLPVLLCLYGILRTGVCVRERASAKCVWLRVCFCLRAFKQHTCVQGPLQECLQTRRFQATWLLHTTCVHSCWTWRATCVAALKTKYL